MEGRRIRDSGFFVLVSVYGHRAPLLPGHFSQGSALHLATPFEKGVDPKTFLRMGNTLFMERHRIRNAGTMDFREPIYGLRSPSPLWVFCAFVQAGRSLCTKHRQTVRLRLYTLKEVFEGSKGRFFKNAPWQGVGQRPTESEKASPSGHAFSGGTRSLHETPTDRPALPSRT